MQIIFTQKQHNADFEIVERKGVGHPDTLADHLAEYLSVMYSQYTKKRFGAVLHHNFDKIGLLGGKSSVRFGSGKLIAPIRILVNGRASFSFGETQLDIWKLLTVWATDFLLSRFPNLIPEKDLFFINNLSTASSPGQQTDNTKGSARNFWFQPRNLDDLPELKSLFSNDTSLGVGFAPYSLLEKTVLSIEDTLNSIEFKLKHPWIGSDIKIMGVRKDKNIYITMCIPQIASEVKSLEEYKTNLRIASGEIACIMKKLGVVNYDLSINTRDSEEKNEFYLTAIGSSIESGDEGLVGRGNRINRIITPCRSMTMEGAAGKNPVYHIGKVYHLFAHKLAHEVYEKFGIPNTIGIVSQSGRSLSDPWILSFENNASYDIKEKEQVEKYLRNRMSEIHEITEDVLNQKYQVA